MGRTSYYYYRTFGENRYSQSKTTNRAARKFYDLVTEGESRRPYFKTSRQTFDLPDGRHVNRFTACTDTVTQVFTLVIGENGSTLFGQTTKKYTF